MSAIKFTSSNLEKTASASPAKRPLLLSGIAMGMALAFAGCGQQQDEKDISVDNVQQPAISYNGVGFNGVGFNGVGFNGVGFNGVGFNGVGFNGVGFNGVGFNGVGFNGVAWGGIPSAKDCNPGPPVDNNCTSLHDWINHTDANGNGIVGDDDDKRGRVMALEYWVSCACPAGTSIPFSDTHGLLSTTFNGAFGLAPTWCGADTNVEVPEEELQVVSACLLARVNMRAEHVPLSIRGYENSLTPTGNELMTHRLAISSYFGNLWKSANYDIDPNSNEQWWNKQRFACTQMPANSYYFQTQPATGRTCDVDSCSGNISHLGYCQSKKKKLSGIQPVAPSDADPELNGGVQYAGFSNPGPGNNFYQGYQYIQYRGKQYRQISVNMPLIAEFEQAGSACKAGNSNCSMWTQWMGGTLQFGQAATCPTTAVPYVGIVNDCMGTGAQAGKLWGLTYNQSVQAVLTAATDNSPLPSPSGTEPMSVAIRYSNGGAAAKGLRLWASGTQPNTPDFVMVHGVGSGYYKQLFQPTGSSDTYKTVYVYPVYAQDTSGWYGATKSAGSNTDTLRLWVSGETANTTDAPHLDAAYFFPGPPPGDRNWVWTGGPHGDSYTVQTCNSGTKYCFVSRYAYYTSPTVPPGTYRITLAPGTNDMDLYVKLNANPTTSVYDCASRLGMGATDSCTITVTTPSTINVMMYGYTAGATITASLTVE